VRGDEPVREAATEIDLRGMRVDEATPVVQAALDAAVLAEEPELRIIHGMGTGALRDAVRQLLEHDARVATMDFAIRQQGGTGVTVAVLR
jgi:DNA mismatch repair protein MutS2